MILLETNTVLFRESLQWILSH